MTCSHCNGNGCDPLSCQRPQCANDRHPACPVCLGSGDETAPNAPDERLAVEFYLIHREDIP